MSILCMNDVYKHKCNEDDLIASNFPSEDTNLASMVSIAKYSFISNDHILTFDASFSSFSSKEILTELFFRRTHSASCQTRLFSVSVAVSPLVFLVPEDTLMSMHCLHNGNPHSGQPVTLLQKITDRQDTQALTD